MTHHNGDDYDPELPDVVADQLPAVVADQLPGALTDPTISEHLADHVTERLVTVGEVSRFNENKDRIDVLDSHSQLQQDLLEHQQVLFEKERRRTNHRLLVMFLVIIVVFVLLAVRTEVNAANLRRATHNTEVSTWTNCLNLNVRAGTVNATNQAIITFLTQIKPAPPGLPAVIAVFKAGILPTQDCGPRP